MSLCDSPAVGNQADNLRRHAAILTLVRTARQFEQLAKRTAPAINDALSRLPEPRAGSERACWADLLADVRAISERAEELIDSSPLLTSPVESEAGQ